MRTFYTLWQFLVHQISSVLPDSCKKGWSGLYFHSKVLQVARGKLHVTCRSWNLCSNVSKFLSIRNEGNLIQAFLGFFSFLLRFPFFALFCSPLFCFILFLFSLLFHSLFCLLFLLSSFFLSSVFFFSSVFFLFSLLSSSLLFSFPFFFCLLLLSSVFFSFFLLSFYFLFSSSIFCSLFLFFSVFFSLLSRFTFTFTHCRSPLLLLDPGVQTAHSRRLVNTSQNLSAQPTRKASS